MEPGFFSLGAAGVVVAAAVCLMIRQIEVRLVLLGSGLVMALLAGKPLAIFDTFATGMVANLVAPICAAMGFAAVLRATRCDRHLIHLLLVPVRRARGLVLPGGIVAAYVVNAAIPSQAAAAAAIGPILVPLLLAAGYRAEVAAAALLLGASFGGDLLNPGDQNVQAVVAATGVSAEALTMRVFPAGGAGVLVAAVVFALLNRRGPTVEPTHPKDAETAGPDFRLNPLKVVIPLVPIALLLLANLGFAPLSWLLEPPEGRGTGLDGVYPIVRAMLIGCLLAALVSWRDLPQLTARLFEGMGEGYGKIITMIITAQCFGAGLTALGVCDALLSALGGTSWGMALLAVGVPWGLAVLSGSGSGPIFTFADTVLKSVNPGQDLVLLGALTCLGGSFGRTMSPMAPVVIYSCGLVGAAPLNVIRLVLPGLLAGAGVALLVVWWG